MADYSDEEDYEQLKLAIALSLQGPDHKTQAQATISSEIHYISDDETEGLNTNKVPKSIEASQCLIPSEANGREADSLPAKVDTPGLLGLDRKAMEAERLARKRKAPISPPPLSKMSQNKHARVDIDELDRPLKHNSNTLGKVKVEGITQSASKLASDTKLEFPGGVIKKTWSIGCPRLDDIKLEEVLQKSDLQLAVLSSFQWDIEWLFRKINMKTTKLILVMQAKEESTKRQYLQETAELINVRLCFPSMAGNINCMHSKLMLLSYPTYLRVVVPTANLVSYDWGELGVLENSVFIIDLPRLPEGTTVGEDDLTFFAQELVYFCKAMGLQQEVTQSLYKFDFSATSEMAFVHTIGGEHTGSKELWRRTGYCGLGRAVSHLGLNTKQAIQVDFIASSLGAINTDLVSMLYLAAQGDDGTTELEWRLGNAKSKGTKPPSTQALSLQQQLADTAIQNFKIYFPSRSTVLRSRGGTDAAGPICFQQRWYESPKFPKQVLRDCKSTREGLLMHNKVCLSLSGT